LLKSINKLIKNITFKLLIKYKIELNNYYFLFKISLIFIYGDCGDWGLGPIPNPQSPIPNPQSPIPKIYI
jgi:hypothetical protein